MRPADLCIFQMRPTCLELSLRAMLWVMVRCLYTEPLLPVNTQVYPWVHPCSSSTSPLSLPITLLRTIGDRAFPVAATKPWNSLPVEVMSARSLQTFTSKLKTPFFCLILVIFLLGLLLYCEVTELHCIFKPPPPVGAGGGYMFSGRPSVLLSVRPWFTC